MNNDSIWGYENPDYLVNLKGKNYMQVHGRLDAFWRWVRDNKYRAKINPSISIDGSRVMCTVNIIVYDEPFITPGTGDKTFTDELYSVTGNASEVIGDGWVNQASAVENCETSAIGRALATLGFGIRWGYASKDEIDKHNSQSNQMDQAVKELLSHPEIKEFQKSSKIPKSTMERAFADHNYDLESILTSIRKKKNPMADVEQESMDV